MSIEIKEYIETRVKIKSQITKRNILQFTVILGFIYCVLMQSFLLLEGPKDPGSTSYKNIVLSDNSVSAISSELKAKGFIHSELVFSLKAYTSGIHQKMSRGEYELSQNMSNSEIIAILTSGAGSEDEVVKVTIPEGTTVEGIATILKDSGVLATTTKFLQICRTMDSFEDNFGVKEFDQSQDIESGYGLEGFLFPDTYEFYKNTNPYSIIGRMLSRFEEVYTEEYSIRANQLGYSITDVISLAAIIEKESGANDFNKVSAVLFNRISSDMKLQVDSTIRYALNSHNTISLTSEQYSMDSAYNSYLYSGYGPTPICNPGDKAIMAVLYPNEQFVEDNYLYFCLTDLSTDNMVFSKTYEAHMDNVKKYKNEWDAYDSAIN